LVLESKKALALRRDLSMSKDMQDLDHTGWWFQYVSTPLKNNGKIKNGFV